jgi:hypothetical protein
MKRHPIGSERMYFVLKLVEGRIILYSCPIFQRCIKLWPSWMVRLGWVTLLTQNYIWLHHPKEKWKIVFWHLKIIPLLSGYIYLCRRVLVLLYLIKRIATATYKSTTEYRIKENTLKTKCMRREWRRARIWLIALKLVSFLLLQEIWILFFSLEWLWRMEEEEEEEFTNYYFDSSFSHFSSDYG